MTIGYIVGSATTEQATALLEKKIRNGYYVVIEYDDEKVLGLVTQTFTGSPLLDNNLSDIEFIQKIKKFNNSIPYFVKAKIKLLCKLNGTLSRPDIPPVLGPLLSFPQVKNLGGWFFIGELGLGGGIGTT